MKRTFVQQGFSAAELLITLFIASLFLIAGYQLYTYVVRDGEESAQLSKASNLAYQYLRSTAASTSYIKSPCSTSSQPGSQALSSNTGLNNANVNVIVSCPYSSAPLNNTSLLTATVTYSGPNGQETATHAMLIKGKNTGPPLGALTLTVNPNPGSNPVVNWNSVTGPGPITYTVRTGTSGSTSDSSQVPANTVLSTCENITATTCTITGLTTFVYYTVTVTATNTAGASSDASTVVRRTPP